MSFLKRLFGGSQPPPPAPHEPAQTSGPGPRGIFAGLFVASPAALEAWDISQPTLTPDDWPAMEFKHLETVKMGTLEAILTGVPYDDIDQDALHNLVREGGPEGPWISRVRQPLVDALAALDPARASEAGAAWADTDEFKVRPTDKPSPQNIQGLAGAIVEMAELARTSRDRGEPMFLMMGL